jgi:citrate-Mg2+:H+ or citrate-Ca2+:H+ symporter, CitMHS family
MASNQAGISPPPSAGASTALRVGLSLGAVALVAALAMLHAGTNQLALLGLATILVLLVVIMTEAMSPLIALIAVPIAGSLAAGFKLDTGKFIVRGIQSIAPVAGMFVFAILFFGVMTDAGMLDPIIDRILKVVGTRPTRVVMGSALLALLIHLDGSGAVCFLITIPAMLPLYDRLGMDKRILALACSLAAGVNFLPWTGPTIRAAAVLHVPATTIFQPILKVQIVGLVFIFLICYLLGKREEKRLGLGKGANVEIVVKRELKPEEMKLRRPKNFLVNLIVTLLIMTVMIAGWVDPVVGFMVCLVLALMINYPDVKLQKARVDAHAKAALMMAGILLAAGAFTGIMSGTNMLKAMATAAVKHVPASMGQHIPFGLGIISMPLSLLFDPDSFYFGVLPVVSEVYKNLGGQPIQVAQAALMGQMTVGFPVSPLTPATFLVVGLCGIELGVHQKFAIPYLLAASVVMTIACALFGVFPF